MARSGNAKKFASQMDAVMSKVEYDPNGGCWLWAYAPNTYGYGQLWWANKQYLAHRIAYESAKGPVPEGLLVLHRCDRPACCNPDHLFVGTPADNMADRDQKGRHWVPLGEHSPHAKLTDAQAAEIKTRYARGGVLQRELAAEFGVTRGAISDITRGRNFKHVGAMQCQ